MYVCKSCANDKNLGINAVFQIRDRSRVNDLTKKAS